MPFLLVKSKWCTLYPDSDVLISGQRAQAILQPLLLRRTKNAKLEDGRPILDLPKKDIELVLHRMARLKEGHGTLAPGVRALCDPIRLGL